MKNTPYFFIFLFLKSLGGLSPPAPMAPPLLSHANQWTSRVLDESHYVSAYRYARVIAQSPPVEKTPGK